MTEDEREWVKQQSGTSFERVLSNVKATEEKTRDEQTHSTNAKIAYRDALDEFFDADPQNRKLGKHVRDYMKTVSDTDKNNPETLKRHFDIASSYAKGKSGLAPVKGNAKLPQKHKEVDDEIVEEDEIKEGTHDIDGHRFRIKNLTSDDWRKATKHPDKPHGLLIKSDIDKEPKFK